MTRMQETWSDVEVSAYLDRELDPAAKSVFEAALANDQALRRRVDDVREVVALVRAIPLREPPRNYLLTPAMVAAKPVKRAAPRWTPLLMMRLATSLAAVAFVVTAGLSFVSRGISPAGMVMQSQEAAEVPVQLEVEVEVTKQVELLSAAPQEMPAPASGPAEGERAEKALAPQADMALAPATEAPASEAGGESMSAQGVDGGAVVEPEVALPQEAQDMGEATGTVTEEPAADRTLMTYATTDDHYEEVPVQKATVLSWWIPGILGLATLCLVGMTYWMSRRR